MKNAVDKVFTLLWLRDNEPEKYPVVVDAGALFRGWCDEPTFDFNVLSSKSDEPSHRLNVTRGGVRIHSTSTGAWLGLSDWQ
jgi:hypothetical protein